MSNLTHYLLVGYCVIGLVFGIVELHYADQEYPRPLRRGGQPYHNSSVDILFAMFVSVTWPVKGILLVLNWLRSAKK